MYYDVEPYQESPNAFDAIPGVYTGMAFNQQRSLRTLTSGLSTHGAYKNTSTIGAAINNTLNPRNFSRLGSYDAFHAVHGKYTPYNFMAPVGNVFANTFGSGLNPAYNNAKGKQEYFTRGTLARSGMIGRLAGDPKAQRTAAARIGAETFLDDAAGRFDAGKKFGNIHNTHAGVVGNLVPQRTGTGQFTGNITKATGSMSTAAGVSLAYNKNADVALRLAFSSKGAYSQALHAYQARVTVGAASDDLLKSAGKVAGLEGGLKAYSFAEKDLTKAGLDVVDGKILRGTQQVTYRQAFSGAKGAAGKVAAGRVVGMGVLGKVAGSALIGPAAAAMLAYDVGQLAGAGIKAGINLVGDAAESLQGSINKPVFGMGFKDTQFAATSRARGVMAIQNSRLNARSAMGSEAGMLAAHFG